MANKIIQIQIFPKEDSCKTDFTLKHTGSFLDKSQ